MNLNQYQKLMVYHLMRILRLIKNFRYIGIPIKECFSGLKNFKAKYNAAVPDLQHSNLRNYDILKLSKFFLLLSH